MPTQHVRLCAGSTEKLISGGIPLGLRIVLGVGAAIGIRAYAWEQKSDGGLLMSMTEAADANREILRRMTQGPQGDR